MGTETEVEDSPYHTLPFARQKSAKSCKIVSNFAQIHCINFFNGHLLHATTSCHTANMCPAVTCASAYVVAGAAVAAGSLGGSASG